MEEKIETRISPERIWEAWEKAHASQNGATIVTGRVGQTEVNRGQGKKGARFKYEICDVVKGERFSLIWKTLFVRLIFTHSVLPKKRGSEIRYSVQIRGFFAIPVRWLLGNKIRYNISQVLKTMVKQLENQKI
jgi:hypothetical protein